MITSPRGFWFQKPFRVGLLEPETSNFGLNLWVPWVEPLGSLGGTSGFLGWYLWVPWVEPLGSLGGTSGFLLTLEYRALTGCEHFAGSRGSQAMRLLCDTLGSSTLIAVKELSLSYYNSETMLFGICP